MNFSAASIIQSGLRHVRHAVLLTLAMPVLALAFGETDDEKPPVPADTLIPVCVSAWQHMCGLIDGQGRWVVQFKDRQLEYRDEGVWAVLKNGWTEQLLDARGQPLARLRANSRLGDFSEGLAVLDRSGNSYVNLRAESMLAGPYEVAGGFHEGLAVVGKFVNVKDGGHYSLGYIDKTGREVIAPRYHDASAFRHGLAVVGLGEQRIGAIDRQQQMRVPAKKRMSLQVVAEDRLLTRDLEGRTELIDGRGRTLFAAQSISEAGEGMAFFSNSDNHLGLLNLRTGQPVVKAFVDPKAVDWHVLHPLTEGRAWLQISQEVQGTGSDGKRWERHLRLIDAQGRTVAESKDWQWAQRFVGGSSSVYLGDERGSLLLDRDGKPVAMGSFAAQAGQSSMAWFKRLGPVHVFTLREDQSKAGDKSVWVDSQGRTLFVLTKLDCGIEQLRSPQGQPLWPVQDVAERCVLEAESRGQEPDAKYRTAAKQERLQQLRDENDQGLYLGPEAVLREVVGLPMSPFPLRRNGVYLSDKPEWVDGPATIELHGKSNAGVVRFQLPAGYRYLPPAAIASLRKVEREADRESDSDKDTEPQWGVIAEGLDPQWAARVQLIRTGRLQPPQLDDLDPEKLAQTIRRYDYGSPLSQREGGVQYTMVDWTVAPQWDKAHQRLTWGLNKSVIGQAKGISPSGVTLVQAMQGNISLVLNVSARRMTATQGSQVAQQLQALTDTAVFAPAEGESPEAVVGRDLASLIVGHKPAEVSEFERKVGAMMERERQKRAEQLRDLLWQVLGYLVPLLLMLFGGMARYRQGKHKARDL